MEAPPTRFPARPDLARMRRDRTERLREVMRTQGVDAVVLSGNTNVVYATGAIWPFADESRSTFERPVAVVLADDGIPHLFTPIRRDDRLRSGLPEDHLHGPALLDFDEGVERFLPRLASLLGSDPVVAFDEWTHPLRRAGVHLGPSGSPIDAGRIVSKAKLIKTPDEVSCLREGLRIMELGIADVQAKLAPGVRQVDLTATFLRTVFEAGADANILDPIWQVMPRSIAEGPWTTTGDLALPLLSTERELAVGDVLWVDLGLSYEGMHTDFGRTWIVGREPNAVERDQFDRWRAILDATLAVTRAGARNSDLTAAATAANGGIKPWLPHFYLGHGLGIDSAEMPFVGSDIGEDFDASYVLEAGMVLVLEPVIWDDGQCGYRSEEVVLITEDGWEPLTDYSYDPF
ncbi:MAG TPA: M24 family metallopeptidase [Mycobacteriales bacterium]|nr:M24 family metallopeptidase [Mycobacteriales bacterium]